MTALLAAAWRTENLDLLRIVIVHKVNEKFTITCSEANGQPAQWTDARSRSSTRPGGTASISRNQRLTWFQLAKMRLTSFAFKCSQSSPRSRCGVGRDAA